MDRTDRPATGRRAGRGRPARRPPPAGAPGRGAAAGRRSSRRPPPRAPAYWQSDPTGPTRTRAGRRVRRLRRADHRLHHRLDHHQHRRRDPRRSWRSCSAAATRAARWRSILIGFSILLGLVYFPYFWQRDGQTPGMSMFDIRVVRDADGGKVDWLHAILRFIGYGINSIVFGLPIGWLWVFVDKRRRGWMDLIGSTVVVKS